MPGKFITIEGTDGAGKTTQITLLVEYIKSKGREVVLTREPGGTPVGEKIRDILLDAGNKNMNYMTEVYLYTASRSQHLSEVILPAVEEGKIVVCDRFLDSSIAYQGFGRGIGFDKVLEINQAAIGDIQPDITLFFDLPPEIGIIRKKSEKRLDRMETEDISFHKRVYEGYRELLAKYPQRIKRIDAYDTVENVNKKAVEIIDSIL